MPLSLSNESGRALGNATTDWLGPGAIRRCRVRSSVPRARGSSASRSRGARRRGQARMRWPSSAGLTSSSHVTQASDGRLPLAASEAGDCAYASSPRRPARREAAQDPRPEPSRRAWVDGDAARVVGAAALANGEARVVVDVRDAERRRGRRAACDSTTYPTRRGSRRPDRSAWSSRCIRRARGTRSCSRHGARGRGVAGRRTPAATLGGEETARARGIKIGESPGAASRWSSPGVAGGGRWTGRVVDGHEGTPVADARVSIERPGFDRAEIVASATSDADGAFVLSPVEVQPGDRLVAEGSLHARLRAPVPPFGEIRVALVSRRRALLERLVGWARRKGRPYDARPEPTPGHVQRMARSGDAIKRLGRGRRARRLFGRRDRRRPRGGGRSPRARGPSAGARATARPERADGAAPGRVTVRGERRRRGDPPEARSTLTALCPGLYSPPPP